MGAILLTILIVYLIVSLFGYFVHKALHQSWTGRYNSSHMAHHLTLYPPEDYLSDEYRDAGKDDTFWTFAIISLPVVITPILLYLIGALSFTLSTISLIEMLFIGWLNSFLHNALHIRNHWMTKIPVVKNVFAYWNKLHYLHHVDMQKNYGIFSFAWDKVFRTFWKG
jgi:sterol desaturase/sphingolipid hydroxylase (fatty acid hydroxylase superfamily)